LAAPTHTTRGLRISTRCATIDQFVATFHRFCDERSFFVSTHVLRPIGFETAFSLDLLDNKPALRGLAVVDGAWPTAANPFGRPGMKFAIKKLTTASQRVFEQLRRARATADAADAPREVDDTATARMPLASEATADPRTPGSELVLPANPLAGIPDSSLTGFVECSIYEETGNFFPVEPALEEDADPEASPPDLAPRAPRAPSEPTVRAPTPPPLPPPVHEHRVTPPPTPVAPSPPPDSGPTRLAAPGLTPGLGPIPVAAAIPGLAPIPVASPVPVTVPIPRPVETAHRLARVRDLWTRLVSLARGPRRRLVAGIAVGACAVVVTIVVVALATRSSSAADHPLALAPLPTTPMPPASAAPAAKAVTPAGADSEGSADQSSDPSGLPLVGSGPCKLIVTSTPAGSTVSLDGNAAGPTPLAIAGPCGSRRVDLAHPRYASATRTVKLVDGKSESLDVTLQRPTHKLFVTTTPAGATVSIAGRRAGTTPTYIDVMGFSTIEITVGKAGYQTVTKQLYSKVPSDRLVVQLTQITRR
jgi:hypothetical protein